MYVITIRPRSHGEKANAKNKLFTYPEIEDR